MEQAESYEAIVIGAGQGGGPLASARVAYLAGRAADYGVRSQLTSSSSTSAPDRPDQRWRDWRRFLLWIQPRLATGRLPNTDTLNLEACGLRTDERGRILVNERLETTVPDIYAIGDARVGPAFTHISYDDFRILRTNLLEGGQATTRDRLVPYTIFLDPQLGRTVSPRLRRERAGAAFA